PIQAPSLTTPIGSSNRAFERLTVRQRDLHDLSSTGRKTETEIRYIEIAVGSEGHSRWKAEAGRDYLPVPAVIQADDSARVGDEWSRGKEAGKRLQSEQRSVVESDPGHRRQPAGHQLDVPTGSDLMDAGVPVGTRIEDVQVTQVEVTVVGHRGWHDMTEVRRDVDQPTNRTGGWLDHVDLAMVWLDRVELPADRRHAIPGAVRLEVGRLRVCDRVRWEEGAQVCDVSGAAVGVDPQDAVMGPGEPV